MTEDKITQHILDKYKHAPSDVQEEKIEDINEREEAREVLGNKLDKATKDIYGELEVWTVNYALINDGTGSRCAWCNKPVSEINNLDKHLKKHEK